MIDRMDIIQDGGIQHKLGLLIRPHDGNIGVRIIGMPACGIPGPSDFLQKRDKRDKFMPQAAGLMGFKPMDSVRKIRKLDKKIEKY